MADATIQTPDPSRQVRFHDLLVLARKTWLLDALDEAYKQVDFNALRTDLAVYVPGDAQRILAVSHIRDEHVFPTPTLLEAQPTLVGYYRLLLGVPQKTFYRSGTGMGLFRSMEVRGTITPRQRAALPAFCAAMGQALAMLIRDISPTITLRDIADLPLLTLGAQFQGGNNNIIGQVAIKAVFLAIPDIVEGFTTRKTDTEIHVMTPEGRRFLIALANDPDVRVQEMAADGPHNCLAIEVKGGTDTSNVYNRGGEAEKSHQGAKEANYGECWTIIGTKNVDMEKLKRGSPTTDVWFDTAQILAKQGRDWVEFQQRIVSVLHLG